MQIKEFYLKESLKQAPQIISWVDRDRYSATCGCFDRLFWGWKLKDFPDATLQRAVFPLAVLWKLENNVYHNSDLLFRIIKSGIDYWGEMQHKNGAVDQAFPFEYSYGATAFSLNSIIKAYKIIESDVSKTEQDRFKNYFIRSASFLVNSNEAHGIISNHIAGASIALLETYKLTDSEKYLKEAKKLINIILENQSSEGWYVEYEGFDAGYQTLATYYLAQCWEILQDEELLDSLKKSIQFLSYFIHPDGTAGGEYGSRNTQNLYMAGFEILRAKIPLAGAISDKVYQSLINGQTIPLNSMDPGNLAPLMTNYLLAYQASLLQTNESIDSLELPYKTTFEKYFPKANLYVKNTDNYYFLSGISKGGVIHIIDKTKSKKVWHDGGYIGQLKNGDFISSQMYSQDVQVTIDENSINIMTNFYKVLNDFPSPFRFFILRFLNLTFMRNIWFGNFIKKQLVRFLISGKKSYSIFLERHIRFEDKEINITDKLSKDKKISLKFLHYGIPFTTIHMATSKYYSPEYLLDRSPVEIDVNKFNKENSIQYKKQIILC